MQARATTARHKLNTGTQDDGEKAAMPVSKSARHLAGHPFYTGESFAHVSAILVLSNQ